jgi:hypothetical protein
MRTWLIAISEVAILLVSVPLLHGQSCTVLAGSAVKTLDAKTYAIDFSASLPAGNSNCVLPFTLPAPGTIIRLQGTASVSGACDISVLTGISTNNSLKYYSQILRTPYSGGEDNVFIDYHVPLSYTNGSGNVSANSIVAAGCQGSVVDIHAVLELQ